MQAENIAPHLRISGSTLERWTARAEDDLESGVTFGVGAAFDFQAGKILRALKWMKTKGFQWLRRLVSARRRTLVLALHSLPKSRRNHPELDEMNEEAGLGVLQCPRTNG
jgi:hypothetical protein